MIFCYARVSSDLQVKANGTDAQRAVISAWLTSQGRDAEGAEWFEDLAVSGKSMERPAWSDMLGKVRKGDTVVVYSLSRAGRNLAGLCAWVERMQEQGVRVVFLKESIDIGTPTGRLMLHMLGAIAEYEREIIRERASDGVRTRIAKGERWGGARVTTNKRGTTAGCRSDNPSKDALRKRAERAAARAG